MCLAAKHAGPFRGPRSMRTYGLPTTRVVVVNYPWSPQDRKAELDDRYAKRDLFLAFRAGDLSLPGGSGPANHITRRPH